MRYVMIDAGNLEQLQEGICEAERIKRAGKSMRNIAEALGLSLGYVYKILNMNLGCGKSRYCQTI